MATRAEQAHAESQRTGAAKTKAAKEIAEAEASPKRNGKLGHSGTKATYARESRSAKGKATRKLTRASANRAKPDSSRTIHEEGKASSSDARFRRSKVKGQRVRGS